MFDHLPNKITKIGNNAHNLLETLFPYNVVIVNPNESPNDKIIELILTKLECPICGNKLHFNDCWNKKKELRVTFVWTCHYCCKLFLLIGRFDREVDYISAYRFFDNNVYSKNKNGKKKGGYENTKNQNVNQGLNQNSSGKQNSRRTNPGKQNSSGDRHI